MPVRPAGTLNRYTRNDDPRYAQLPERSDDTGRLIYSYIFTAAVPDVLRPLVDSPQRETNVTFFATDYRAGTVARLVERARAWARWEFSTISLWPDPKKHADVDSDPFAVAFARIECHYFVNGGFLDPDDQIIRNLHKIKHIPCNCGCSSFNISVQGQILLFCTH